jgi:hypothetical protein
VNGNLPAPGAASFPGPRAPPISEARNDRGTNITIPYARVVPHVINQNPDTAMYAESPTTGLVAGSLAFIWRGGGSKSEAGNRAYSDRAPAQAAMLNRGRDVNRQQLLCTMDHLNRTLQELDAKVGEATLLDVNNDVSYNALVDNGFLDWVLDGVILSKLESPTGEPLASQELDMMQGALYNLAVGGPAICTAGKDKVHGWLPLDTMYCVLLGKKFLATNNAGAVTPTVHHFQWAVLGSQELHDKEKLRYNDKDGLVKANDVVICGAFKVGKILDSAAARQRVTSGIRRTPGGCAVNLNVNIEWITANHLKKLHGRRGASRAEQPSAAPAAAAPSAAAPSAAAPSAAGP